MKIRASFPANAFTARAMRLPAQCWPTVSPYFVVHPGLKRKPGTRQFKKLKWYTVAHVHTGLAVAKYLPDRNAARKVAGALTGLPVRWNRLSKAGASRVKLPPEVHEWLRVLVSPLHDEDEGE